MLSWALFAVHVRFDQSYAKSSEEWAEQQLTAVAETSVYTIITKWFELAEKVEYAVVLEGSSRRGKTYACVNYCRAYPHKFRFLATPDEPSDAAMLDALFQAIGIEGSSASRNPHKRRKLISEALQYSRITCIFDEAQFLFPPALNRTDAHHVFPRNYLKGQGLSRGRYNQIANHVLAQSEINIAIGDKPPEK